MRDTYACFMPCLVRAHTQADVLCQTLHALVDLTVYLKCANGYCKNLALITFHPDISRFAIYKIDLETGQIN